MKEYKTWADDNWEPEEEQIIEETRVFDETTFRYVTVKTVVIG